MKMNSEAARLNHALRCAYVIAQQRESNMACLAEDGVSVKKGLAVDELIELVERFLLEVREARNRP